MSLFDWNRDERKAAIRRLTNGRIKQVALGWRWVSIPEGTRVELENGDSSIYRFPTQTEKLNPLEAETMAIQRIPKEILRMQYGRPISLDDFLVMMTE